MQKVTAADVPQVFLWNSVRQVPDIQRRHQFILGNIKLGHSVVPPHQLIGNWIIDTKESVFDVLISQRIVGIGRLLMSTMIYTANIKCRTITWSEWEEFNVHATHNRSLRRGIFPASWLHSGVEKMGFKVLVFLNQKPRKFGFIWFLDFYFFLYKFCTQTIIFYYNFIFNLHEFTLPLVSTA